MIVSAANFAITLTMANVRLFLHMQVAIGLHQFRKVSLMFRKQRNLKFSLIYAT